MITTFLRFKIASSNRGFHGALSKYPPLLSSCSKGALKYYISLVRVEVGITKNSDAVKGVGV